MKSRVQLVLLIACCTHLLVTPGSIMRRTIKSNKKTGGAGAVHQSGLMPHYFNEADGDDEYTSEYEDYSTVLHTQHTKELLDQRKRMQCEHAEHIKKLHQERDQLTAQLAQERTERHQLEQRDADHKRKISLLEKDLSLYKQQAHTQREQLDECAKILTVLKKSKQEIQESNVELLTQVDRLGKERDILAKNYKQQWEEQFAKSSQEITLLKQRVHATQERYTKSLQTLKTKEAELAQKDRHIGELQGQLRFHTDRVAHLEHHVRELNKNVAHEQQQRTTAQAHIRKLEQQQYDLRLHNESLTQQIAQLRDSMVQEEVLQDLMPQEEHDVTAVPAACVVAQK